MKIIRWFITLAYAGLIFYLSSRTWTGVPSFPLSDKVCHVLLYIGFGGLVLWLLRATGLKNRSSIGIVALLICVLYGLSDEIHQLYVTGREFSVFDLMADAVGSVIGIWIATKLAVIVRRQWVLI